MKRRCNRWIRRILVCSLAACLVGALEGCVTRRWMPNDPRARGRVSRRRPARSTRPVLQGILTTPGTAIGAEDESFSIVPGDLFESPFQSGPLYSLGLGRGDRSIIDAYPYAEEHGARRVLVTVPNRTEPLHGILALCEVRSDAYGPAPRTYEIRIPEEQVAEATHGRISVVYELYAYGDPGNEKNRSYAWVLWLSDVPIPEQ